MARSVIRSNSDHRRVTTRGAKPGESDTFEMPLGNDIMAIIVEVSGTVQLTTGATTVSEFGASQLIRKLELLVDGSKPIQSREGFMACLANFEMGLARELINPGVGVATHPVSAQFVIDLASYGCARPKDSALHTTKPYMSRLDLVIDYGTPLDMFSVPGAAVVGAVNLTTTVWVEESIEFGVEGLTEARLIRRVVPFEHKDTNSAVEKPYKLAVDTMLRGIKMVTFDNATARPVMAPRVTSLRLKANNAYRRERLSPSMIRGVNRREFNTGAYLDALPTMFYIDMLPEDGSTHKLWNLRGATNAEIQLDYAANTWIKGEFIYYDVQPALTG